MLTLKVFFVTKYDSVWTETDIKALHVKCSYFNDIFYILINTQTSVTTFIYIYSLWLPHNKQL